VNGAPGQGSTDRGEPQRRPPDRLEADPLLQDHPLAMRVAGALWILSALLFLALAVPALADRVQSVDGAIHRWAVSAEWDPAVYVAKAFGFLGSAWVTSPLMVVIAAWLAWRRRWEALATWVSAMAISQVLIGPTKDLYARSRPPLSLVATTGWSFPSGHAVAAATITLGAVIVLVTAGPRRRNLELLAAAFAVVMAISRVYLRAHWPSDAAAGLALGAAIAIGCAAIVHRIDAHRHATR
jgi:membrane-associated phospholipid phosphatase